MFNKPLILALFISLSFNGLFGYLSYKFYSDKAVVQEQLKTTVESNKSLQESYNKKETACKIADGIAAEYQEEKQELVGEKDQALRDIDEIVSLPAVVIKATKDAKNGKVNEKINISNLDDGLPPDAVSLLSEVCHRSKGSTCVDP